MPRRYRFALALCCLLPSLSAADSGGAIVGVDKPADRVLSGDREGLVSREVRANFGFGPIGYAISQRYLYHRDDPSLTQMGEGYIGMPAPASANWYHSGFMFIRVSGQDVGRSPASSMMAVESGGRAILDMVWRDEAALARARFFGLPGANWLGCEVTIEPVDEVTDFTISLRNYPSFFTSHHRRDGARRIQTPTGLVEQGQPTDGPLSDHWWGVYYDEVFDVARGEGQGPCAMLVLPVEGASIRFSPGSYAVGTDLIFTPETRTVRFAFWDFRGYSNAEALAELRDRAAEVREVLEAVDLTPTAIAEFDVAAVRESLEAALASERTREALADDIGAVQRWLAESAPQIEQADGPIGIAAQEDLLRSIDDYNSFKWQVRLTTLLDEL